MRFPYFLKTKKHSHIQPLILLKIQKNILDISQNGQQPYLIIIYETDSSTFQYHFMKSVYIEKI